MFNTIQPNQGFVNMLYINETQFGQLKQRGSIWANYNQSMLVVSHQNEEVQVSSSHLLFGISPESAITTFFLGFPL